MYSGYTRGTNLVVMVNSCRCSEYTRVPNLVVLVKLGYVLWVYPGAKPGCLVILGYVFCDTGVPNLVVLVKIGGIYWSDRVCTRVPPEYIT